ncbi:MAG: hypothetical protein JWP74_239 [Marmoricola sp.]|nr:hypothetical protein [Marmoricola sp.]
MAEMRAAERPPEPTRLRWWFEDASGHVVLGQAPNAQALAASGLAAASRVPGPPTGVRTTLRLLSYVASCAWGLDEAVRGVTPARRIIGGVTAIGAAARLGLALSGR